MWMFDSGDDSWVVLSETDQKALESGSNQDCVPVVGGRYDAYLDKRCLRSVYQVTPVNLKLQKCVWFEDDSPFSESESAEISEWAKSSCIIPLFLGDRKVYKSEKSSFLISGPSILSVARHVRKFGDPDCPVAIPRSTGDDPSMKCKHLIITVHGIGEALWSKKTFNFKPFERNCEVLRSLLSEYCDAVQPSRVEVLPVTWFHILSESLDMKRMTDITLNTIPVFRQIANGAISDIIFYLNKQHREKIVVHVIERIKELVSLFRARNPHFTGPISLIGHSLGSVICFDALSSPDFPADEISLDNLFLFGSPLGVFLTARDQAGMLPLSGCRNVFNLIQPNDPVCYRIEPLLVPLLRGVDPEILPYHKTGGLAATTQIRKTASSIIGFFSADNQSSYIERLSRVVTGTPPPPEPESPVSIGLKSVMKMNNGSRIDWIVQQGFMPAGTDYADAITAHMSYFDNRDVARFVYERCN